MRRDRQQPDGRIEPRVLQQAAGPALPGQQERVGRRHVEDVGGHRQVHPGGQVGHHLVATVAAGGQHDRRRGRVRDLGQRGGPGRRGVVGQRVRDHHVHPAHPMGAQARRQRPTLGPPTTTASSAVPSASATRRPSASASSDSRSGLPAGMLDQRQHRPAHAAAPAVRA